MIYRYVDNGYQLGKTNIYIYIYYLSTQCVVWTNIFVAAGQHVMSRDLQLTGSNTFMQYIASIGSSD